MDVAKGADKRLRYNEVRFWKKKGELKQLVGAAGSFDTRVHDA